MDPVRRRPELRVGDTERDEVVSALREHFAQGRLTRDELDERLTATLRARTAGELHAITRDLPGAPYDPHRPARHTPPWAGRVPNAHRHAGPWAGLAPRPYTWPGGHPRRHGPPVGLVVLALVAAVFLSGGWVIFSLVAAAVATPVLRHALHGRPPGPRSGLRAEAGTRARRHR